MPTITLTPDQQSALDAIINFITDPSQPVFVLEGYSGTGKSTLVKEIIKQYGSLIKTSRLIDPDIKELDLVLTATTNKAAEALNQLTNESVVTIHSFLGLRVQRDYKNNTSYLVPRTKEKQHNKIIFIDEASYIDRDLLKMIFRMTENCKIIFIGDPAQLLTVRASDAVVFNSPFPKARLTEVVRQAEGNPIIDLSTKFRGTVNNGEFFSFIPDGQAVQHMERAEFDQTLATEFSRPDWKFQDSKVLAWTNKRVIQYNQAINDFVKGVPTFQANDYAVCNSFIHSNGVTIKTDQLVGIRRIDEGIAELGLDGKRYHLKEGPAFFAPNCEEEKKEALRVARANGLLEHVRHIEEKWIDLRAAYACTINKAQGSTYDRVFIDLDDISRCNNGNTIARMLYVGISRARHQVIFTGDFG